MIDDIFEKFDDAFSENTLRAYRSDFKQYEAWCAKKKQPSLPATLSTSITWRPKTGARPFEGK